MQQNHKNMNPYPGSGCQRKVLFSHAAAPGSPCYTGKYFKTLALPNLQFTGIITVRVYRWLGITE
jgi:hypothetical protein